MIPLRISLKISPGFESEISPGIALGFICIFPGLLQWFPPGFLSELFPEFFHWSFPVFLLRFFQGLLQNLGKDFSKIFSLILFGILSGIFISISSAISCRILSPQGDFYGNSSRIFCGLSSRLHLGFPPGLL